MAKLAGAPLRDVVLGVYAGLDEAKAGKAERDIAAAVAYSLAVIGELPISEPGDLVPDELRAVIAAGDVPSINHVGRSIRLGPICQAIRHELIQGKYRGLASIIDFVRRTGACTPFTGVDALEIEQAVLTALIAPGVAGTLEVLISKTGMPDLGELRYARDPNVENPHSLSAWQADLGGSAPRLDYAYTTADLPPETAAAAVLVRMYGVAMNRALERLAQGQGGYLSEATHRLQANLRFCLKYGLHPQAEVIFGARPRFLPQHLYSGASSALVVMRAAAAELSAELTGKGVQRQCLPEALSESDALFVRYASHPLNKIASDLNVIEGQSPALPAGTAEYRAEKRARVEGEKKTVVCPHLAATFRAAPDLSVTRIRTGCPNQVAAKYVALEEFPGLKGYPHLVGWFAKRYVHLVALALGRTDWKLSSPSAAAGRGA